MSTPAKPPISVSVGYLGPIFNLDSKLTKSRQHLVFARNGTGKSFISRAFRYLDLYCQGESLENAPLDLVSEEAESLGHFRFSRGETVLGSLDLNQKSNIVNASVDDVIFHVFSEDFINKELREQQYEIDGEIENQIAIDESNIDIQNAEKELKNLENQQTHLEDTIRTTLDKEKSAQLHQKSGVSRNLKDYKEISAERLLREFPEKPERSSRNFKDVQSELDKLKSIPSEISYPRKITNIGTNDIDIDYVKSILSKITSISSVSDDIKLKIDKNYQFFEQGVKILEERDEARCPF
jgi:hypothetical protein